MRRRLSAGRFPAELCAVCAPIPPWSPGTRGCIIPRMEQQDVTFLALSVAGTELLHTPAPHL